MITDEGALVTRQQFGDVNLYKDIREYHMLFNDVCRLTVPLPHCCTEPVGFCINTNRLKSPPIERVGSDKKMRRVKQNNKQTKTSQINEG